MNQMEIFKNPEFGSIRTFEQDGKVLFCGKDIAKALGYQRTADPAGASGRGRTEPHLHAAPQKGG